jgi:hypothetical protein
LSKSGGLLPGINAVEVDQGIQGVNAPKPVGRIASMTDKSIYITVHDSIKFEKTLLRKI